MFPYADFHFFGLMLLYVVIPTTLLGLCGRANARWALFMTVAMLLVIFGKDVLVKPGVYVWMFWMGARLRALPGAHHVGAAEVEVPRPSFTPRSG